MTKNDIILSVVNEWSDSSLDMLYNQYYKALVVYACNFVSETAVAEDLVQEAFTALWQRKPVFDNKVKLRVYIYNAVRNAAISHLRRMKNEEGKMRLNALEESMQPVDNSEDDFFEPEVYRLLMQMIEKLSARQREVFLLAMEGKRNSDIAHELSISLNTVKVLKNRALNALKSSADNSDIVMLLVALTLTNW